MTEFNDIDLSIEGTLPLQSNKLLEAFTKLTLENPFECFDLNISQDEINSVAELHVGNNIKQYDRYGNVELFKNEVIEFLNSLAKENSQISTKVADTLNKLLVNTLSTLNKEDAHIRIIAERGYGTEESILDGSFCWHTDGDSYTSAIPNNKIFYTFKGASTLFYPFSSNDDVGHQVIIENFDTNKVLSCKSTLQAAITIERSALHASPKFTEDRLLFWIVPGSKQEIEYLEEYE